MGQPLPPLPHLGQPPAAPPERRSSVLVAVVAVVAVVLFLAAGLWLAAGVIAPTYVTSIIAGIVWFVIASVLLGQVGKRRPELKWPVRGAFLATAVIAGGWFAWTTFRDETVNERLATGTEQAAGDFQPVDHGSVEGRAAVIQQGDGKRVLAISSLDVDNGPDLRMYLVSGDGTSASDNVDLGALKGNKGNQQYDLPADVDIGRYKNAVVWCRAFSVAFARAPLTPPAQ